MCYCYSEEGECVIAVLKREKGETIAIYVLASLVLLLSTLVAYLLYKMKTRKYCTIADDQNISTIETVTKIDHPQVNQEKEGPPEINFGTLKKKAEELKVLVLSDENDGSQRLTNPVKTPITKTPQINIGELKSHLMKTRQGIIHQDEIQKICKNELTKSDQTLNKPNNNVERSKVKTAISQIEKSASVNLMLEEDTEYDVLPTAKPVEAYDTTATSIQNLQSILLERVKRKTSLSKTGKTLSSPQLLQSDEEYDVLPSSRPVAEEIYDVIGSPNNVIILDPDTHYLSFISQTPPAVEPSYINANLNK